MQLLKLISLFLMIVSAGGNKAPSRDPLEDKTSLIQGTKTPEDKAFIARIEKPLLSLLGLKEKPNIEPGSVKVPPYMLHLYRLQERFNNQESLKQREETVGEVEGSGTEEKAPTQVEGIWGNTIRSFTHVESAVDALHPSHIMLFRFEVNNIASEEKLKHAELRIFHTIHPSASSSDSPAEGAGSNGANDHYQKMLIYDVLRPVRKLKITHLSLLQEKLIDARTNGTVSIDVSRAIKRWLKKPRANYGIYVEVLPMHKTTPKIYDEATRVRLRRSVHIQPDSEEWTEQQPLLVVHTNNGEEMNQREKRSTPPTTPTHHKRPLCRRHRLYVDFRKVEWNTWIVAPPGYDAFYCQGECPYPLSHHMNATNHAVIQNIIHSRYPSRVPSACCVPVKHSAISMLYLDTDKKVVLKTYQDMIVESCGCQ